MASTDVTTQDTGQQISTSTSALDSLSSGAGIFSTFSADTPEARVATFNAISNAERIDDNLGKTIMLRNVVAQAVEIADMQSGEVQDAVRVILLDDDGTAYAAVSGGLVGSLRDLFGIFGKPETWSDPLPVKVEEIKTRAGRKAFVIKMSQPRK